MPSFLIPPGLTSSWTKQALEVDSPPPMSPWDQLADPPDSTCAQVIHSRPEAFSNNWVPIAATREFHGHNDNQGNFAMGNDPGIRVPANPDLQLEGQAVPAINKAKLSDLKLKGDGEKLEKEKLEMNSETPVEKLTKEAADLGGALTSSTNPQIENLVTEVQNDISKTNIKDKTTYDTKEIPSLELSLKRLIDTLTGNVGSCSPLGNSSEAAKTESLQNPQSNTKSSPDQPPNGSSNNNDMGSTTNDAFIKPGDFSDKPMPKSTVNVHPCSAFQPVQSSQVQVQHHHHHYHHYHHHVHNMQQQQQQQQQQQLQLPNHDDLSLRTIAAAPHGRPSNLPSMPIEGIATNYSMNGSASGSNNGSNGQHGSSTAIIIEGTNMASDNGATGKCGAAGGGNDGSGSAKGSSNGVDQNRCKQREAALNKFRQKRKERCFEKKVRYQSRKRLAEQRPRIRGQFVRQVANENKSKDKDC
ncbi:unnamed protein product [Thlaspi arvense]|uniref:CCT domain-containing protein n=1 Tax=Thlaspi arvense TaxID=13288 RepID=A0AAU9RFE8_THLAR|nr:unnamed protein product [Thlaspi arvense]